MFREGRIDSGASARLPGALDSDEEEPGLALFHDIPRLELRRPTDESPNNAQVIDDEICSMDFKLIEEEAEDKEDVDLDPIHQAITTSFGKIERMLAVSHDKALKMVKKCMEEVRQKEKSIRDLQKQVTILEQGSRHAARKPSNTLQVQSGSHLRRPTPSLTTQSRRSWRAPSRSSDPKKSWGASLGGKVSEFRAMNASWLSRPAAAEPAENGDTMGRNLAYIRSGNPVAPRLGREAEEPEEPDQAATPDHSMSWKSSSSKPHPLGEDVQVVATLSVPQAPCESRRPLADVQAPAENAPSLKLPTPGQDSRDEGTGVGNSVAGSRCTSRGPSPAPPLQGPPKKPPEEEEDFARRPSIASLQSVDTQGSTKLELLPQWSKEVKQRPKNNRRSLMRGSTQDSLASVGSMSSSELPNDSCMCSFFMMFDPNATPRATWDIGSIALVIYDMVMIPLQLFELEDNALTIFCSWTTRLFWTWDIYMSFMTGVLKRDGLIEYRFSRIAKHYLSTWFAVDFLIVSIDWVEVIWSEGNFLGFARAGKASRTFRIIRMLRLLRLARVKNIMHALFERIESEQLSIMAGIVSIMCVIVGLSHVIACVWYGLATEDRPDTWLRIHNFADASVELKYTTALHWSLLQFAGGTDEIVPQNVGERVYAVGVFILAFVLASIFVGRLTSSMTQLHMLTKRDTEKFQVLKRYLSKNAVSSALAMRVIHNAQHALAETQRFMEESQVELLSIISEPLRVELHFELYAPVLSVHPFFNVLIESCPQVVKKVCHTAMSQLLVSAGDVVFMPGEVPHPPQMFIVCSGELSYHYMSGSLAYVEAGQWLAEGTLWTNWIHQGMLKAASDCRLVRLDASKFVTLTENIDLDFDIRSYAKSFVNSMNCGLSDVSDLPFTEDADDLYAAIAKLEQPKGDPFASDGESVQQTSFETQTQTQPDGTSRWSRGSSTSVASPGSACESLETPQSVLVRKSSVLMVTPSAAATTPKKRWPWG